MLHICHAHIASAMEGSPSPDVRIREGTKAVSTSRESYSSSDSPLPDALCSQIERDFLIEVGRAEELARDMGQVDGTILNNNSLYKFCLSYQRITILILAETAEMPDAVEIIFQSALTLGRHGAVSNINNLSSLVSFQNIFVSES